MIGCILAILFIPYGDIFPKLYDDLNSDVERM